MNICLLYPVDYDKSKITYYSGRNEIIKDLRLSRICAFTSRKDSYIEQEMLHVMMAPLPDKELIRYRHEIIEDCMQHHDRFVEIYDLCKQCMERTNRYTKENWSKKSMITTRTLIDGIKCYQSMMEDMRSIQGILEYMQVKSKGLHDLRSQMIEEHGTYPIIELHDLKEEMESLDGAADYKLYLHAKLGHGFKLKNVYFEDIVSYKDAKGIHKAIKKSAHNLFQSLFSSNTIDLTDASTLRQVEELRLTGLEQIQRIYVSQIKLTLPFFEQLRSEIAFYIGAFQYRSAFKLKGLPICLPSVETGSQKRMGFQRLYEPLLGYLESGVVVSNDCENRIITETVISGANQGGKSTYLKSIGIAQVMMQCGMFVNAESFSSSCYNEIFTHFSRNEDKSMTRSRFEDELMRLDLIFSHITPDSLLLMNESFANTTEEEGSKIASDLTQSLYEAGIPMFFVSHLYQYVSKLYEKKQDNIHFLNAERKSDGTRTYKMLEQAPDRTSYGMDLFDELIGI